jgi:hypothetical protein
MCADSLPWWWGDSELVLTLIESPGPWPVSVARSNGICVPLDVDRYGDLAMIVAFGPLPGVETEGVAGATFAKDRTGTWRRRNGGGSGYRSNERSHVPDETSCELLLKVHAGWGSHPTDAIFLCGPEVARVDVKRRNSLRTADVSEGPGWLGIIWPPDDPPLVRAYDAGGEGVFAWAPPDIGDAPSRG